MPFKLIKQPTPYCVFIHTTGINDEVCNVPFTKLTVFLRSQSKCPKCMKYESICISEILFIFLFSFLFLDLFCFPSLYFYTSRYVIFQLWTGIWYVSLPVFPYVYKSIRLSAYSLIYIFLFLFAYPKVSVYLNTKRPLTSSNFLSHS